jgi:hypothetical protein
MNMKSLKRVSVCHYLTSQIQLQRFKGQNLPHSIFAISRPPSELMVLSMHTVPRRKKGYLGGAFLGAVD